MKKIILLICLKDAVKFLSNVIVYYSPKSCFGILISYWELLFNFKEFKLSYFEDMSSFCVMIYNSKT